MLILLLAVAVAAVRAVAVDAVLPQLSQECAVAVKHSLSKAGRARLIQSLDSWGKPVGVMQGAFTSLGDFGECLDLN